MEGVADRWTHCFRRDDTLVLKVLLKDEAFRPGKDDRYYAAVCASDQEVTIPLEEYVPGRIWIGRHRFQEPHLIQRNAPLLIYFKREGQQRLLSKDVSISVKTFPPEPPYLYAIPKGDDAEFVWTRSLMSEGEVVAYDIERQTPDGAWQSVLRLSGAGPLVCRVVSPVWGDLYRITLTDWGGYTASSHPLRLERACESNSDIFYMISTTTSSPSGCFQTIVRGFTEVLQEVFSRSGKTWQTRDAGCAEEIIHFHLKEERIPNGFRFLLYDEAAGRLLYEGLVAYPEAPQCAGMYERDRGELMKRLEALFRPVSTPEPARSVHQETESSRMFQEISLEEAEAFCRDQRGLMTPGEWLDRYGASPDSCKTGEYVAGGFMHWEEDKGQWVFEPLFQPQVRHVYGVRCRGMGIND